MEYEPYFDKRIKELAEYLGISPDEIQLEDNMQSKYTGYLTPEGTFTVMDEDEAREACYEYIEDFIDDCGISGFTPYFQDRIYSEFIDDGWFEDACREMQENYAYDIEHESGDVGATRLIDECIDAGIISEDDLNEDGEYTGDKDLVDEYAEYLFDRVGRDYSTYAEWYVDDFGDIRDVVRSGAVSLDLDGIVDACIDEDGYGHNLASYDGYTIELPNFMAFKQDDRDERTEIPYDEDEE